MPTSGGTSRPCRITERQAQRKFKHAASFGVFSAYSPANAIRFRAAILAFVNAPTTVVLRGTYNRGAGRGGFPADFYHDPASRLDAVVDTRGDFVTGSRLNAQQDAAFRRTGTLGGGAEDG